MNVQFCQVDRAIFTKPGAKHYAIYYCIFINIVRLFFNDFNFWSFLDKNNKFSHNIFIVEAIMNARFSDSYMRKSLKVRNE